MPKILEAVEINNSQTTFLNISRDRLEYSTSDYNSLRDASKRRFKSLKYEFGTSILPNLSVHFWNLENFILFIYSYNKTDYFQF